MSSNYPPGVTDNDINHLYAPDSSRLGHYKAKMGRIKKATGSSYCGNCCQPFGGRLYEYCPWCDEKV